MRDRGLIEPIDAVGKEFEHGVEFRIDGLDGLGRQLGEFTRGDLSAANEIRQTQGIVVRILREVQGLSPGFAACACRWPPGRPAKGALPACARWRLTRLAYRAMKRRRKMRPTSGPRTGKPPPGRRIRRRQARGAPRRS